ncbi:MAG: hypothetical protein RJA76_305 [Bacteroidota bacterium]|jgi:DNA-binding XRE family transcriptional regulator/uncharacterized protein YlzI (FlbEa/FlbD family)
MTLTEKIELLIKRTQMSASQFADVINIPRSSISHIVSGRNKPSLDVVQKILKSFPEISAEELLYEDRNLLYLSSGNDSKKIPSTSGTSSKLSQTTSIGGLFDHINESPRESDENKYLTDHTAQANLKPIEKTVVQEVKKSIDTTIEVASGVNQVYTNHVDKVIERVVIFYSDGTFSESKPSK